MGTALQTLLFLLPILNTEPRTADVRPRQLVVESHHSSGIATPQFFEKELEFEDSEFKKVAVFLVGLIPPNLTLTKRSQALRGVRAGFAPRHPKDYIYVAQLSLPPPVKA